MKIIVKPESPTPERGSPNLLGAHGIPSPMVAAPTGAKRRQLHFLVCRSVASQRECHWHSFTTVPSFNETIGNMRYEVVLIFAENSQQTVQDRLKRVILHEANSES